MVAMQSQSEPGGQTTIPTPRIHWRVAIAVAASLTIVFSTQNIAILGGAAAKQTFADAVLSQALMWGLWLLLLPLVFAIGARARVSRLTTSTNIALQILVGIGVALLHSTLHAVARWSLGITPWGLRVAVPAMISFTFAANFLRYWLIAAAYHALAYHREARERDVREARLATNVAEARLEALEGRLQPHFLFNTLNAIASLIRKDPRAAAVMVGHLSDLLRAALEAQPGREVTLANELELLERYTAIQHARFSDRLSVSIDAAPGVLSAYVPPMILQPIVENAIRHGIAPREASGTLTIEAARHGGMLRLVVRDDGIGFGRAPTSTRGKGLGISGTRERLAHLYGAQFRFDVAAATPTGTVVTIELPFHVDGPRGLRIVA
jgi:two-component system, LytTR family, sensor kinase